jgi:HD superfamily phosphodiesterase
MYPSPIIIKPEWFNLRSPSHDVSHTLRVMRLNKMLGEALLSSAMSGEANVASYCNIDDLKVALYCSFYAAIIHDMGRFNEYEEPKHGHIAAETKMHILDEIHGGAIPQEWVHHIKFAVTGHSKQDKYGDNHISNLTLKLLKDADSLDRVRFDDLDTTYLRLEVSENFVETAYQLYNEFPDVNSWEELNNFSPIY